jgi:hypothetical protein
MPLRKTRYFHYRPEDDGYGTSTRRFNAVTMKMEPNQADATTVLVSTTFCSPKDPFNRKLGRSYADKAPPQTIRVIDLPYTMAESVRKTLLGAVPLEQETYADKRYYANQYAWIWKYFL